MTVRLDIYIFAANGLRKSENLVRAEKRSVEPSEEAPPSMADPTEDEGNEADNCSEPPASESKPKSKAKTRADCGSGKVVSRLHVEMTRADALQERFGSCLVKS